MDVLTDAQCWDLLGANQIGRLAVVVAGRPDIFPVNYVVNEGEIYFRTGEGSKGFGPGVFPSEGASVSNCIGFSARRCCFFVMIL